MSGKLTKKEENKLEELVKKLKNKKVALRCWAAWALGKMGEKAGKVIPALIEALKDENTDVRSTVVLAFGNMGEKAIPALIEASKDKDANVRSKVVRALERMDDKAGKGMPVLIEALNDKNWVVRMKAAQALGAMGEIAKKAVSVLIEALNDENASARSAAAWALGMKGEKAKKSAIHALKLQISKEKDKDTKFQHALSLIRVEGKEGEGTGVIEKMKKRGELNMAQIFSYERLCQKLAIKQNINTTTKKIQSITQLGETQIDSNEKQELIKQISELKEQNTKLTVQIEQFISFQRDPWNVHIRQLTDIYQQLERDDLTEEKKKELERKAATLSNLGKVLPPYPEKKKKFFEKWTWEKFLAAIVGAIISGIVGFLTAWFIR